MIPEHEQHVRAFYDALAPGHREPLFGLQSAHVVYELPAGMPTGGGRFHGIVDVFERFVVSFHAALDVRFVPEEFLSDGEQVVVLGTLEGRTREGDVPIHLPFVHVWTIRDHLLERLRFFTDTAILARALAEGRRRAQAATKSR